MQDSFLTCPLQIITFFVLVSRLNPQTYRYPGYLRYKYTLELGNLENRPVNIGFPGLYWPRVAKLSNIMMKVYLSQDCCFMHTKCFPSYKWAYFSQCWSAHLCDFPCKARYMVPRLGAPSNYCV